jgi:hypothetical protein
MVTPVKITEAGRKKANSSEFADELRTVVERLYGRVPDKTGEHLIVAQISLVLCELENGPTPSATEVQEFLRTHETEINAIADRILKDRGVGEA